MSLKISFVFTWPCSYFLKKKTWVWLLMNAYSLYLSKYKKKTSKKERKTIHCYLFYHTKDESIYTDKSLLKMLSKNSWNCNRERTETQGIPKIDGKASNFNFRTRKVTVDCQFKNKIKTSSKSPTNPKILFWWLSY